MAAMRVDRPDPAHDLVDRGPRDRDHQRESRARAPGRAIGSDSPRKRRPRRPPRPPAVPPTWPAGSRRRRSSGGPPRRAPPPPPPSGATARRAARRRRRSRRGPRHGLPAAAFPAAPRRAPAARPRRIPRRPSRCGTAAPLRTSGPARAGRTPPASAATRGSVPSAPTISRTARIAPLAGLDGEPRQIGAGGDRQVLPAPPPRPWRAPPAPCAASRPSTASMPSRSRDSAVFSKLRESRTRTRRGEEQHGRDRHRGERDEEPAPDAGAARLVRSGHGSTQASSRRMRPPGVHRDAVHARPGAVAERKRGQRDHDRLAAERRLRRAHEAPRVGRRSRFERRRVPRASRPPAPHQAGELVEREQRVGDLRRPGDEPRRGRRGPDRVRGRLHRRDLQAGGAQVGDDPLADQRRDVAADGEHDRSRDAAGAARRAPAVGRRGTAAAAGWATSRRCRRTGSCGRGRRGPRRRRRRGETSTRENSGMRGIEHQQQRRHEPSRSRRRARRRPDHRRRVGRAASSASRNGRPRTWPPKGDEGGPAADRRRASWARTVPRPPPARS